MFSRRGKHEHEVYVVTSAGRSRREEIDERQRKYLIKMGIRTVCLILAIVLYALHVPFIFLLGLIIASTILPWMSVVVANGGPDVRETRRQHTLFTPDAGPALPAAPQDRQP